MKVGQLEITHDGTQWIVGEYYVNKKNIVVLGKTRYFLDFDSMVRRIKDLRLQKIWDASYSLEEVEEFVGITEDIKLKSKETETERGSE